MYYTAFQIAQGHHFEHELSIQYVHCTILTAKARNESSVVSYESATVSVVRNLALGGSSGTQILRAKRAMGGSPGELSEELVT